MVLRAALSEPDRPVNQRLRQLGSSQPTLGFLSASPSSHKDTDQPWYQGALSAACYFSRSPDPSGARWWQSFFFFSSLIIFFSIWIRQCKHNPPLPSSSLLKLHLRLTAFIGSEKQLVENFLTHRHQSASENSIFFVYRLQAGEWVFCKPDVRAPWKQRAESLLLITRHSRVSPAQKLTAAHSLSFSLSPSLRATCFCQIWTGNFMCIIVNKWDKHNIRKWRLLALID